LTTGIFNKNGKYYFLIFEKNKFSMTMKWNFGFLNIRKLFKINIIGVLVHKNHLARTYFVMAQLKKKSGKPAIA
jgi:hypothetical protein